ncbi:MAG TPA: PDDEXK nuclease domain-containing protein [Myxococcota bacterium]|nr:PDDEXK nuclease domain-containing protein [Myxococcota bacterium]HRY96899.1 PDDEXK nuclease domain-containing protein [Myxococcota bacterium]
MKELKDRPEEALFKRVAGIIEAARGHVARTVNSAMVHAYWLIGREIVEVEQQGKVRAGYGDELIDRLAERLADQYGKGFGPRTLRRVRLFFLTYPKGSVLLADPETAEKWTASLSKTGLAKIWTALLSKSSSADRVLFPPFLGWAHYLILMRVANPTARAFYEIEAARESWSSRELERQIASLLFERLVKSRDKVKVLALAKKGHEVVAPRDVVKDPFVLEFLDLPERHNWLERDLEQAIIDRIGDFLLELGKGFCFVARQKRLSLDGDHFYVDLVFYNRLLRCFVLIDLKLGKLTHQDLGQMMMYVNWFDRFQKADHEQPTVGIVLCSEKNDAVVRITLPADNKRILAARYLPYLPSEDELRAEVTRSREDVEHRMLLEGGKATPPPKGATRVKGKKGLRPTRKGKRDGAS